MIMSVVMMTKMMILLMIDTLSIFNAYAYPVF